MEDVGGGGVELETIAKEAIQFIIIPFSYC